MASHYVGRVKLWHWLRPSGLNGVSLREASGRCNCIHYHYEIMILCLTLASHCVGWLNNSEQGWPRAAKQPKPTICDPSALAPARRRELRGYAGKGIWVARVSKFPECCPPRPLTRERTISEQLAEPLHPETTLGLRAVALARRSEKPMFKKSSPWDNNPMSNLGSWLSRLFKRGASEPEPLIDKTGEFWKSKDPIALEEYLESITRDGYLATQFRHSICTCGGRQFFVAYDENEGLARRCCDKCRKEHFLFDSEMHWPVDEDDEIEELTTLVCPCKGRIFNLCSGFAMRDSGQDIKWITVGCRCTNCGTLGAFVDLKISESPSLQFLDQT